MTSIKVKMIEGTGRGVVATRPFSPGEPIAHCELLVLSAEDTEKVNQTELKHYTFKYNATQDCLVLGLGEIFNHDANPNAKYELQEYDGRMMMVFTATHTIRKGDQIFIDYAADTPVDAQEYIDSKSMIG